MTDRNIVIPRLMTEKEASVQTETRAAILSGTDDFRDMPSDRPAGADDFGNDIPIPDPEEETDEEEEQTEEKSTLFEDLYWYYERT